MLAGVGDDVAVRIGIGGVAASVTELHESYQDAVTASWLRARETIRTGWHPRIAHISDYRVHHLIATTDSRTRARFADTVIGELRRQQDWPTLRETILAWCESGFHLVRAAKALHAHRNTLVSRLRKIENITSRQLATTGSH